MSKTTQDDVDTVLRLKAEGYSHAQILGATNLSKTVISKILDGWKPVGKKAVKLTRNVYRRGYKAR